VTTQATTVPKILVAVHGIGDQIANATVQSVAFRVYEYYGFPPAVPLGRFHRSAKAPPGVELFERESDPKFPARLGFAEVYWADVPRGLVTRGFTLENAKLWARTLVARLNIKAAVSEQMDWRQYRMLETVVDELVDAVFVLDNLTFLADRAGLFKFDLKKVLDDFLNDVQVVTEFDEFRNDILKKFGDVMDVIANDPKAEGAEIYVVGHSEGSVVAYFGLLNALSRQPEPPTWVDQVRGLMTIGSPIETHLLLWADLWKYSPSKPAPAHGPIVWWNYMDYGDPIAYRLTKTREWMTGHGWDRFFRFPTEQDVGFSRYVLPGKAHVDYWGDRDLFAHFIENVVNLPKPERRTAAGPVTNAALPQNRWFAGFTASVFPYALVGALMFLAVYFLYTPVATALKAEQSSRVTFGNLTGLTLLLAGMTAAVRIPRVTPSKRWWLGAGLFFLAALGAYPILVAPVTQELINSALAFLPLPIVRLYARNMALPFIVLMTTVVATVWSYRKPARGVWPLLLPGSLLALAMVVQILRPGSSADTTDTKLWPLLLGSVAFLYLWWLATLLFDLSVVWHSYVRWSSAMDAMRQMIKTPGSAP
jgi:hypothetical protein